jgi:hypothetical protein
VYVQLQKKVGRVCVCVCVCVCVLQVVECFLGKHRPWVQIPEQPKKKKKKKKLRAARCSGLCL